jgi:phenylacetic acid degradation operon negative regulatory protein
MKVGHRARVDQDPSQHDVVGEVRLRTSTGSRRSNVPMLRETPNPGSDRAAGHRRISLSSMLRAPTDSLPQRLIVTLLADYRAVLNESVPSRTIVDLLQELDIATEAARSALARLTRRGILERNKIGRETSYRFTPESRVIIEEDQRRILEFGTERPWDDLWTVVVFSVAEEHRDRRYGLKTRLRALGFAPLYDGVWVAAYATPEDAAFAISESQLVDADIFRGSFVGLSSRVASLQEKWEVAELERDYRAFIDMFRPISDADFARELPPRAAFVARTRLMDAWRIFPRREPDLPAEFLPSGWPLPEARKVFVAAYDALAPAATRRVREFASS